MQIQRQHEGGALLWLRDAPLAAAPRRPARCWHSILRWLIPRPSNSSAATYMERCPGVIGSLHLYLMIRQITVDAIAIACRSLEAAARSGAQAPAPAPAHAAARPCSPCSGAQHRAPPCATSCGRCPRPGCRRGVFGRHYQPGGAADSASSLQGKVQTVQTSWLPCNGAPHSMGEVCAIGKRSVWICRRLLPPSNRSGACGRSRQIPLRMTARRRRTGRSRWRSTSAT